MPVRAMFWSVFASTLGVYAAMVFWSIPTISAQAAELPIFDMRPGGYNHAEALDLLNAITPEGTDFYLRVQHRLDLVYPPLLALTSGWAMVLLLPHWRWRYLLVLVPLPGMVFDYLENRAVSVMLSAGAQDLTPEMVAQASIFSRLKAAFTTLSLGLLLLLVLLWIVRKLRSRQS